MAQQAGLTAAPVNTAAQAGLGDVLGGNGPINMMERTKLYQSLINQGIPETEVRKAMGLSPLSEEPMAAEQDDSYGFGDKVEFAARQALGMPMEGVGKRLNLDWLEDAGEWISPNEDMEQRRAETRQERADAVEAGEMSETEELARNVGDSVIESSGSLAGAVGAGMAGGAAGSVLGPVGAAVGAAIGAATYGVAAAYGESYDQAEAAGLDTSDPNVMKHIDASALATGALDAIPSFRIGRKLAPSAVEEIIKRTAEKGLARTVGKEGAKEFASEGITEAAQEMLQSIILDPDVVSKMTMEDKMALAPEILRANGPQFLEAFLAGGILGGAAGGVTGGIGQRRAVHQNNVIQAQEKADLEALGELAKRQSIPEAKLEEVRNDPAAAKSLMDDLRALRRSEAAAFDAASMFREATKKEGMPEAEVARLKVRAEEKQAATLKQRDTLAKKYGGLTTAEVEQNKKAEEARRLDAATQRVKDAGLKVAQPVKAEVVEKHADKIDDLRGKVGQARKRLERSTDLNRAKRVKQYQKAVEDEAAALDDAAVALEGREPGSMKEERLANIRSEVKAAEREGAVQRFMENEWADLELMTPEERIEKAKKIIPSARKKTAAERETKKKITQLKAEQQRVTSPAEYDTKQRQIEALQASLNANTPRVEAAERVLRGARDEIEQAAEEQAAPVSQPTTSEAEGQPAGSAETQAKPKGPVGDEASKAAQNAAETRSSTATPVTADPKKISDEAKLDLQNARKTLKSAPGEEAEAVADGAASRVLREAGIENPTSQQVSEVMHGAGSVAQRVRRAAKIAPAEAPATEAPAPAADQEATATDEVAQAAGYKQRFVTKDDGGDVDRNHRWTSLRTLTDESLTIEEQERWMRDRTESDRRHPEIAATFAPDGTLNGIGTNGHDNAVTAPLYNWGKGGTYTHTHPYRTPPSPGDIDMLKEGNFDELRAVLPDQTVVIRRGENMDDLWSPTNYFNRGLDAFGRILLERGLHGMQDVAQARIIQEAYLQSLDLDGVIDYVTPMTGFNADEREMINELREAYQQSTGGLRSDDDVGLRAGETQAAGQRGGRPDLGSPQDAAGRQTSIASGVATPEGVIAAIKKMQDAVQSHVDAGLTPGEAFAMQDIRQDWIEIGMRMQEVPDTDNVYGLTERTEPDPEKRVANRAARTYDFGGETVAGMDAAVDRLAEHAIMLPSIETKMPFVPPLAERQAIVIMGPPAAGKSSIAGKLAYESGSAIVDSDEAKKVIPEYADGAGSAQVHEESSIMGKAVLERLKTRGVNLVIPKVGDTVESMAKTEAQLKEAGYTVRFVLQDVTPSSALARMAHRFVGTGRLIPASVSDNIGFKPQETFRTMISRGIGAGHTALDGEVDYGQPLPIKETHGDAPITVGPFNPREVSVRQYRGGEQGAEVSSGSDTEGVGRGAEPASGRPVARGIANLDVRQRTGLRSSDPERVGEIATAMHTRIATGKGRSGLHTDVRNNVISAGQMSDAIAEIADQNGMSTADVVDAVVARLYSQYVAHQDAGATEFVPDVDDAALRAMRERALHFINETSVQLGTPIQSVREPGRDAQGRTVSVSRLMVPPKAIAALGGEVDKRDGSVFTAPGDFDPDTTEGIKLRRSNILEGPALEKAKAAVRFAQRNEYKLIPSALKSLTYDAFLPRKMRGLTEKQRIERFGTIQKSIVNRAKGKLRRLQKAAKEHGDRPIAFRWRIDDKGRMYADGEFSPQVGETIKYLYEAEGMPLKDMLEIDHTGSGWQITAFLAKDHVLAPTVNIHGGQRQSESPTRGDIYTSTNDQLDAKVRKDAAAGNENAQLALKYIIETPRFQDRDKGARNAIKPAVIAVNYGGGPKNFRDALGSPDSPDSFFDELAPLRDENGNYPKGFWSYIDEAGFAAVEAAGPHTAAMKRWVVNALKAAVSVAKERGTAKDLVWTVGRDGQYQNLRHIEKKDVFDIRDRTPGAPIKSVGRYGNQKRPTTEIDVGGTARTIFSQIVQGFDAAILHDALGNIDPDLFITPNHDSYTTPRENAELISDQVNRSMLDVMSDIDITERLMREIDEQVGLDAVNEWIENNPKAKLEPITPFTDFGEYDQQDILSAIPMYAEGGGLSGKVSPFHLPTAGGLADVLYQREPIDKSTSTAVGAQARISTRAPLAMGNGENFLISDLQIDQTSMEATPEAFAANMELVRKYPGMDDISGTPQEIAAAFKERMTQNLLFLHDNAPEVLRTRGHHWYDGARRISEVWGERYGIPPEGVAGALAALSPQTDWFQNVSRAERVLDILAHRRQHRWDPKMARKWNSIGALKDGHPDKLPLIKGKTLQEVINTNDPILVAAWIRTFDETYNDKQYAIIAPEGDISDMAADAVSWGNLGEIAKAVSSALNPTVENISLSMGGAHKVRSFYNNINSPNAEFGDVTIDTHAVAAALMRPLAQSDPEVSHVLGTGLPVKQQPEGYQAARSAGVAGAKGLYGLYADAYREAAAQRGILPRQMQSITWESIRLLYPAAQKRGGKSLARDINQIWSSDQSVAEKQNASFERANGIGHPAWAQPGRPIHDPAEQATYATSLPVDGGPVRGRDDAGAGSGRPGAIPVVAGRIEPAGIEYSGKLPSSEQRRLDAVRFESSWYSGGVHAGSAPLGDVGGLEGRPRVVTPQRFATAMRAASKVLGPVGAQVSFVPPSSGAQRFLLDGGKTGFALDGDNIIGVFSMPGAGQGAGIRAIRAAVAAGGRRLDGFDTFLPKIYSRAGFKAVARLPFDPQYAPKKFSKSNPDGALNTWDAAAMEKMGQRLGEAGWGAPDVVFMVFDPAGANPDTDNMISDYDQGPDVQREALSPTPQAAGMALRDNPYNHPRATRPMAQARDITDAAAETILQAREAAPILDEIPRLASMSPAGRQEALGRVREALDAGEIDRFDLRRLGGEQFAARVIEAAYGTIAPTAAGVYNEGPSNTGGGNGSAGLRTAVQGTSRYGGKPPVARGYNRPAMPIFENGQVPEDSLIRGIIRSFNSGDHPRQTLRKLRHNLDGFTGSLYDRILNGRKSAKQNLAAQRDYAFALDDVLADIEDRAASAGLPDLATHIERMAKMQHFIAETRMEMNDPSMQVNIPNALGVAAPEGMEIVPETRSIFSMMHDVAADPLTTSRTFMEAVEDGMFNRFAPIRRLEISVQGQLGIGAESAYKAAETAVNDSGRNEALMNYGAAKLGAHGEFTVAPGTVGLRTIFDTATGGRKGQDAGQTMADWMGWMVAKRIEGLQQKYPNMVWPMKDIAGALAKEQPQFEEAARQWRAFNRANIQFLVDTGRITQDQADAMNAEEYYSPFYRTDSKVDGTAPEFDFPEGFEKRFGGKGNTILSRNPGIHGLKGGDKINIDNLMKNMIRNSQAMVAAGMRNQAANQIFDLMDQAGLTDTVKGSKRKGGNIVKVAKPTEHAVKIWINGKEKWALPKPGAEPYLVAMAGLQPQQLKGIMGLMANVGSVFRQGITLSPAFMARNLIRGMVANGLLTSGANLTLTNNTLTGFRDAYKLGPATQAFKAMAGMGDFRFGGTDVGFGKNDILIEYGLAPATWGSRIRNAIDKAEHLGSATELADRVAAMQTMIARGVRPDEAAYQARAVMDYARHGGWPWLRAWLPLVPFLNARMQGLSRLTEGAVGRHGELGRKQAMMQLVLNGALLATISAAIWAMNSRDDETEERYESEPLHRRLNYHVIYVGDKAIYIPKAFELGHIFSTLPELFLSAAVRDNNQIEPGVKKILADTLMFNAIPAAMLPIIEGSANYSFFRQGPIEGRREQNMMPRDRVTGASSISRFVGQQLGISDLTNVSPVMIEHYLQGFGGAYFHMLSATADLVAAETGLGSAPVSGAWGDAPVLSSAMERVTGSMFRNVDQQSTRYMEDFYRNKDYITQIYRSAKDAAANGDVEYARRLLEKAGGTQQAYKLVNKAATQLGEINSAIRDVRADTNMTPAQKSKKIEPLIRARNDFVRDVAKLIRQIEEKQGSTFKAAS